VGVRYDLVAGDLQPAIQITLEGLSAPIPTGALATFSMAQADGSVLVSGPAVVDDPVNGIVHYAWNPGDTAIAGVYRAQIAVAYPSGAGTQTWPSDEDLYVVIHPRV
jgi:hypothetical protein